MNKSNIRKNEHMFNAKLIPLKTDLQKQYIDAQASVERFRLAQQEFETIKKVLDNRLILYKNGESDIFTVLSYKKQYNDIEKNYILSKYDAMLKSELLKLYLLM
jgi:outer membrane protein TolC